VKLNDVERGLRAIIYENSDPKIEHTLAFFQKQFSKTVFWGNVGGKIAEKMVRAAYAPMIKFSNLGMDFLMLMEELSMEEDIMLGEQIDAKEKDLRLMAIVKQNSRYEQIYKRWGLASQMRTFYQEMKKSISEALDKRRMKERVSGIMEPEIKFLQQDSHDDEQQIDTSLQENQMNLIKSTSQEDHERLEKEVEMIMQRMLEKGEFLLRLQIPEAWEVQNAQ